MSDIALIEGLKSSLSYDPITGLFVWARSNRRVKAGSLAGTKRKDGYVLLHVCGHSLLAHRVAWLLTYGAWPKADIDHIDGDPSNNKLSNLRDVPRLLNMHNQRDAHSNSSSGVLGVSFIEKSAKWSARISMHRKTKHIGCFNSKEEAHAAYIEAKRRLHAGSTL